MLMTAGPFRPVRLEVSFAHIEYAKVDYDIADDLKQVTGKVSVDVAGSADQLVLSLQRGGNEVFSTTSPVAAQESTVLDFQLGIAFLPPLCNMTIC